MAKDTIINSINIDNGADNGKVPTYNSTTKIFDMSSASNPITLTGDVTGSGTGSIATTIKTNVNLAGSPTTTTQASSDNSTKIATTAYVTTGISNAIAGVNPAIAVQAATTAASDTSGLTYNNGASGIGATFTGSNNTALTIDGYTFTALNQRLLVKNDTQSPSGAFNGVYYVTQIQTAILPPILTRALDYDMPSDINNTGAIPVVNGTVNALTSWLLTSSVNTVGTDSLTYSKFSNSPISVLSPTLGGTGIANNASMTVTGSGNFAYTRTLSGTTNATFPSGTVTLAGLQTTQTFIGINTFTPTARSSGALSYLTITTPADTGITANTESIGINHVAGTRTWADGTVTNQREFYIGAPTYNKTTTITTFTRASTFSVSGAPIAGTGVTITNAYAIDIPGISHFGSQLGGTTQQQINGTGIDVFDSNNTTGGQNLNLGNTSNGTSAFSGFNLLNDLANGGAFTHFAGMYYNSSTYTDTSFGTAFAVANQLAIQNTDGAIAISAQAATGYVNILAGGTATTNEVFRHTTTENYSQVLISQTTQPAGNVTIQANFSSVIGGKSYTIASGKSLTINSGANILIL